MPATGTLVALHFFDSVSGGVVTPVVHNCTPSSVAQGLTGASVTVNGLNFGNTGGPPTVTLSGTGITITAVSYVSASQLLLTVTVAAGAPLGAQDLTVTNPAGDGGLAGTLTGALTVVAPGGPIGGGGGAPDNEFWTGIVFPWQATPAILIRMVSNSDHLTGVNGVTLTLRISKNAGGFAGPSPALTITDQGANGFYKITSPGASANFDTPGEWILEATGPGCDTRWWYFSVAQVAVAYSP